MALHTHELWQHRDGLRLHHDPLASGIHVRLSLNLLLESNTFEQFRKQPSLESRSHESPQTWGVPEQLKEMNARLDMKNEPTHDAPRAQLYQLVSNWHEKYDEKTNGISHSGISDPSC
jgi:hypothetical protein